MHLSAREADGLDHLVEQLAGRADKRTALEVLLLARALADEDEVGMRIPVAHDDSLAGAASFTGCSREDRKLIGQARKRCLVARWALELRGDARNLPIMSVRAGRKTSPAAELC